MCPCLAVPARWREHVLRRLGAVQPLPRGYDALPLYVLGLDTLHRHRRIMPRDGGSLRPAGVPQQHVAVPERSTGRGAKQCRGANDVQLRCRCSVSARNRQHLLCHGVEGRVPAANTHVRVSVQWRVALSHGRAGCRRRAVRPGGGLPRAAGVPEELVALSRAGIILSPAGQYAGALSCLRKNACRRSGAHRTLKCAARTDARQQMIAISSVFSARATSRKIYRGQ